MRLYQSDTLTRCAVLMGHTQHVSASALHPTLPVIVTGSWDYSIRLWGLDGTPLHTLPGHTNTVLAVRFIETPERAFMLSGSSDGTVILWSVCSVATDRPQPIHTFNIGKSPVRSIDVLSADLGLVLVMSNDCTITVLSLLELSVFESFFDDHNELGFVVRAVDSNTFITAGERGVVCIWRDGIVVSTIATPAAVWDVALTPQGDLVTATSDGFVRVFTTDAAQTDPDTVAAFTASLQAKAIPRPGGIEPGQLQDVTDALRSPGTADGQQKIVREGGKVMVYIWSSGQAKWECVGTVVDGPTGSGGEIDGKSYDFVFDVEIEDATGRKMKLGYNNGENPWKTALDWVTAHKLPQTHVQAVAEFIIKNTGDAGTIKARKVDRPAQKEPVTEQVRFMAGDLKVIFSKLDQTMLTLTDAAQLPTDAQTAALEGLEDPGRLTPAMASDFAGLYCKAFATWPPAKLFPMFDAVRLVAGGAGVGGAHANLAPFVAGLPNPIIPPTVLPGLLARVAGIPSAILTLIRLLVNHPDCVSPAELPSVLALVVNANESKHIALARRAFVALALNLALTDRPDIHRLLPATLISVHPFTVTDQPAFVAWMQAVAELYQRGVPGLPVEEARAMLRQTGIAEVRRLSEILNA